MNRVAQSEGFPSAPLSINNVADSWVGEICVFDAADDFKSGPPYHKACFIEGFYLLLEASGKSIGKQSFYVLGWEAVVLSSVLLSMMSWVTLIGSEDGSRHLS